MGIEEEKESCEAVFCFEGVVVQESACNVPPVFVIEWLGGAVPADGGDVDSDELVGSNPADEVSGSVAIGGGVVGEPLVEVGLLEGPQGEVVSFQPGQEGNGRVGALTRGHELLWGQGVAVAASA
ncbi:hypothetical protein ADL21_00140 [Streptomyces albus subsp. albus]|nr:hypothetical protein ADL21_00140 [Streptomyces albus subsp. albus]